MSMSSFATAALPSVPVLAAPVSRGSDGGFKLGWEQEILQKAAAAKKAAEVRTLCLLRLSLFS